MIDGDETVWVCLHSDDSKPCVKLMFRWFKGENCKYLKFTTSFNDLIRTYNGQSQISFYLIINWVNESNLPVYSRFQVPVLIKLALQTNSANELHLK